MVLIPKNPSNHLGLVLEFKREAPGETVEYYKQCALDDPEQINRNHYDLDLKSKPHIQQILKLCLVFHGKDFAYVHSLEDAPKNQD